jgi:predicted peptidase
MPQTAHTLFTRVTRRLSLNYLLHLPLDYSRRSKVKFPLIFFLHGSGERGSNVNEVKKHGIAKIVERDAAFPFIAVSPQCPEGQDWFMQADALLMLLDEVKRKYAVDPARVYLTGLSMGGYDAWYLGSEHSERFAAVVPICGGVNGMLGYPERVAGLRHTPVWAFHGAKDDAVPIGETKALVRTLRRAGGRPKLTIYPDVGHDSWTRTYDNPALYRWLLKHKR